MKNKTNFVFIGGVNRSGTTVLKEYLGLHPECIAINWEPKFIEHGLLKCLYSDLDFDEIKANFANKEHCTYPENKCKILLNWYYRAHNGQTQFEMVNWDKELNKLEKMINNKNSLITRELSVKQFIYFCYSRVAKKHTKYIVIQAPRFSFWVNALLNLFPESIYINVSRNPLDVISSLLGQYWGPNTIEDGVEYYKNKSEQIKKQLEGKMLRKFESRLIKIKFEDFILENKKCTKELYHKLGLKYYKNYDINVESAHIEGWRSRISNRDAHKIKQVLNFLKI